MAFGQKPCVGISNLLVDKKVRDKLHTEKELNEVTSINYHGSLYKNPLIRETAEPNEFEALDGVNPNNIMSKDNDDESDAEEAFT